MAKSLQECLQRIKELKEDTNPFEQGEHYLSAMREFYADLKAGHVNGMEALQRIVSINNKHGDIGYGVELDTEIDTLIAKSLELIAKFYKGEVQSQGGLVIDN